MEELRIRKEHRAVTQGYEVGPCPPHPPHTPSPRATTRGLLLASEVRVVSPALRAAVPHLTCKDAAVPTGQAPEAEGRGMVCRDQEPRHELLKSFCLSPGVPEQVWPAGGDSRASAVRRGGGRRRQRKWYRSDFIPVVPLELEYFTGE